MASMKYLWCYVSCMPYVWQNNSTKSGRFFSIRLSQLCWKEQTYTTMYYIVLQSQDFVGITVIWQKENWTFLCIALQWDTFLFIFCIILDGCERKCRLVYDPLWAGLCSWSFVCRFVFMILCVWVCVHDPLCVGLCSWSFVCRFVNMIPCV